MKYVTRIRNTVSKYHRQLQVLFQRNALGVTKLIKSLSRIQIALIGLFVIKLSLQIDFLVNHLGYSTNFSVCHFVISCYNFLSKHFFLTRTIISE